MLPLGEVTRRERNALRELFGRNHRPLQGPVIVIQVAGGQELILVHAPKFIQVVIIVIVAHFRKLLPHAPYSLPHASPAPASLGHQHAAQCCAAAPLAYASPSQVPAPRRLYLHRRSLARAPHRTPGSGPARARSRSRARIYTRACIRTATACLRR